MSLVVVVVHIEVGEILNKKKKTELRSTISLATSKVSLGFTGNVYYQDWGGLRAPPMSLGQL